MDVEGITTAKALTRERRIQGDFHYALLVICSCIVLLTSIVIADRLFGIDYYDLVRDPNAIAGQPKYFGLVSNLGVILWFTGGIAALQAYWSGAGYDAPHLRRTLLAGGLFSGLMGIDDLLMLHEAIATAGVPEPFVLVPHMLLLATLCYHACLSAGIFSGSCLPPPSRRSAVPSWWTRFRKTSPDWFSSRRASRSSASCSWPSFSASRAMRR